jgi:hypothetical protein
MEMKMDDIDKWIGRTFGLALILFIMWAFYWMWITIGESAERGKIYEKNFIVNRDDCIAQIDIRGKPFMGLSPIEFCEAIARVVTSKEMKARDELVERMRKSESNN